MFLGKKSEKNAITAMFGITLTNTFLPMQLLCGGKISQSFPKFNFQDSFSLNAIPKHFSNTAESLKLLEDIITPYLDTEWENIGVSKDKYALLIWNVFNGQMTEHVKEKLRENYILSVRVPANMVNLLQPLNLTVNRSFNASTKKKFTEWCSKQIAGELDRGISLNDIEVKVQMSVLKLLHARWLMDNFNFMTSQAGSEVISNKWKTAGITEALSKGLNC